MEEYEPHVIRGNIIYAGVDYADILAAAENDPDGCDAVIIGTPMDLTRIISISETDSFFIF